MLIHSRQNKPYHWSATRLPQQPVRREASGERCLQYPTDSISEYTDCERWEQRPRFLSINPKEPTSSDPRLCKVEPVASSLRLNCQVAIAHRRRVFLLLSLDDLLAPMLLSILVPCTESISSLQRTAKFFSNPSALDSARRLKVSLRWLRKIPSRRANTSGH